MNCKVIEHNSPEEETVYSRETSNLAPGPEGTEEAKEVQP